MSNAYSRIYFHLKKKSCLRNWRKHSYRRFSPLNRKYIESFRLQPELSNFSKTFQLQQKLSNFVRFFLTFVGVFQVIQKLSNSFFPTTFSNYMYHRQTPESSSTFLEIHTFYMCFHTFDMYFKK